MHIIRKYACCTAFGLMGIISAMAQQDGNRVLISNDQHFTLEGTLKDFPVMPSKMYIIYDTLSGKPMDSMMVVNGKYKFSGTLDEPVMVTLSPKRDPDGLDFRNTTKVFLDRGTLKATSTRHIKNTRLTGSAADAAYRIAHKTMQRWEDTMLIAARTYRETQETFFMDRLMLLSIETDRPLMDSYMQYIAQHPNDAINPYLINVVRTRLNNASPGTADSLMVLFNRMPANVRSKAVAGKVLPSLENEVAWAIGHKVPAFNAETLAGEQTSLADFKGKYVIVYFQHGSVRNTDESSYVNAWKMYQPKGLDMICFGVGKDKQGWKASAMEQNAAWTNLWAGDATRYVFQRGSGNSILIDPTGTIIARNMNVYSLPQTLSGILD